jgi:hypothetical protein
VTTKVAANLAEDLARSYGAVGWQTELVVDRLVEPPASLTEIVDAARQKLLDAEWDLVVVVTDLPLRVGRHVVQSRVGATHGVAVVSFPALGPIQLRRRLHRTLVDLIRELVGGGDDDRAGGRLTRLRQGWRHRALRELATDSADRPSGLLSLLRPIVVLGNARLLFGMVRANRPWRLAARLYGALVAALAASAYGVVTSDIWRLSAAMGWPRLAGICVVSILVTIVATIAAHELWEHAPDRRAREQVILFNVATASTVAIGIMTLYAALFLLILAGAGLVITPGAFAKSVGHRAGFVDYALLAWFVASLATIGGALGAGLESDEAVREAAYAGSFRRAVPCKSGQDS